MDSKYIEPIEQAVSIHISVGALIASVKQMDFQLDDKTTTLVKEPR